METPLATRDTLTLVIAIYGAVLGTIGAFVSSRNFFRDRSKLRLQVFVGLLPTRNAVPQNYDKANYFKIEITNVGRRMAVIDRVVSVPKRRFGNSRQSDDLAISFYKISRADLGEGERLNDELPLTSELKKKLLASRTLMLEDTAGHKYEPSRRELKRFYADLAAAETCARYQDTSGQVLFIPDSLVPPVLSKKVAGI